VASERTRREAVSVEAGIQVKGRQLLVQLKFAD